MSGAEEIGPGGLMTDVSMEQSSGNIQGGEGERHNDEGPTPSSGSSSLLKDVATKIMSQAEQKIQHTAEELAKLLEDGYPDAEIPNLQEKGPTGSGGVDWEAFWNTLSVIEDRRGQEKVLETKFTRVVKVYQDGRAPWNNTDTEIHRTYVDPEDTMLNMILRRSPPPDIKNGLELISSSYHWSRKLYDILDTIERDDDEWVHIDTILKDIRGIELTLKRKKINDILEHIERAHEQSNWQEVEVALQDIRGTKALRDEEQAIDRIIISVKRGGSSKKVINRQLSKVHDKQDRSKKVRGDITTLDGLRSIFYIRHTWREDTLLMVAARRKPPLPIVQTMLTLGPKAISIVDTPLYDWIPLRYTLNYSALPEVTELLIPTEKDFNYFKYPVDMDEGNERIGVRGNDEEDLRRRRAQFFAYGMDVYGSTALHWTVVYDSPLETVRALVDSADDFVAEMREMGDRKGKKPYEIAIKDGEDIAFIEELTPNSMDIDTIEYDLVTSIVTRSVKYDPSENIFLSLAERIAKKAPLQNILVRRSCETLPTLVLMFDFYAAIFLVVTFRQSVEYLLQDGRDGDTAPPGWWYGLILVLAFMAGREMFQMISRAESYFFRIWNYVELTIVGTVGAAAWLMMLQGVDIRDNNTLIVTASFFSWFNVIIFLRNTILSFAIFVSGMQKIIVGLIPFVIISGLILMGFAEMFWAQSWLVGNCGANEAEDEKFCSYWDSVLTAYSFFVGGIEVRDESVDENNKWGDFTVIAALFGFIVAIVLLNVVIAIVSDLWAEVAGIGTVVYWLNRLEFYHDLLVYERWLYIKPQGDDITEGKDGKDVTNDLEEEKRTLLGKFVFLIEETIRVSDKTMEQWFKNLWVRSDYWGYFDNITDRMLSKEYGGFQWQFAYDWNQAKLDGDVKRQVLILVKSAVLIILFVIFLSFWFVLGLVTGGVLWSRAIRRFILGRREAIEDDDEEVDELKKKLQKMMDENAKLKKSLSELSPEE